MNKNVLSIIFFVSFFVLAYLIASYLIPAIQLGKVVISTEEYAIGLKTNMLIKLLASVMFAIIGACIPQVKWGKNK